MADSPLHKLFLKQWLKEEELITRRVTHKESRLVALREEIIALYCSFFVFNSIIIILLFFTASSTTSAAPCRLPSVPCLCSLACSMAIVGAIRCKTESEGQLKRLLEREKQYGVVLVRCVEELRRKGVELDVVKELDTLRRAKRRSSVERKGKEKVNNRWSSRDGRMLFLFGVSCVVMVITRVKLCN